MSDTSSSPHADVPLDGGPARAASSSPTMPRILLSQAALYLTWQAIKQLPLDETLLCEVDPSYRAVLLVFSQCDKAPRRVLVPILNNLLTAEDKQKILAGQVVRPEQRVEQSALVVQHSGSTTQTAIEDLKRQIGSSYERQSIFRYSFTNDITKQPNLRWLVRIRGVPVIPRETVCFLYGESGVGKSILAQDLAHTVGQQETVVYMALESWFGFKGRREAWTKHYKLDHGKVFWPDLDCTSELPLLNPEAERSFTEAMKGVKPSLIIVDTFSWTLTGGNENDQDCIRDVIQAASRIVKATGATVLFVHHENKGGGMRGSTAIKAGADVVLHLEERDSLYSLSADKARYAERLQSVHFGMLSVDTGLDEDGNPSTAPVFVPFEKMERSSDPSFNLTPQRLKVLQNLALGVVQSQGGLSAKDLIEMTGIPRATLFHILNWLKEKKLIEQKGLHKDSYYLIADAGRTALTAVEKRTAESLQSKKGMVQSGNVIWEIVQPKNPIVNTVLVSESNESNAVQFNLNANQSSLAVQQSNITGTSYRSPVIGLDEDLAGVDVMGSVGKLTGESLQEATVVESNPTVKQADQTETHELNWDVEHSPNLLVDLGESNNPTFGLGLVDAQTIEPMSNLVIERYAAQADVMFSDQTDGESLVEMWLLMSKNEQMSFENRLAQSVALQDRLSESLSARGLPIHLAESGRMKMPSA